MIFLLDYDGTIVPIQKYPHLAKISKDTKDTLTELSEIHKVAIVTGRDIESFRGVFGKIPENIYVVTSHGLEIYKGEELINILSEYNMPDTSDLEKRLKEFEGIFFEKKRGGFAIHYRNFKGDIEMLENIFDSFVKENPPHKVIKGKKIFEAVYSKANKGKGIEELFKITGWDPEEAVYLGDDTTDFDAFESIRKLGGKAYYVGKVKPPVPIDGILKSPEEVIKWLKKFIRN